MLSKTEGVIIRRFNYSDSSRILVIYSARYGQVRLLAKGIRRVVRKRGGQVGPQLFAGGEAVFYPSRSGSLGILREWCETVPRGGLGGSPARYFAASYVGEVVEALTREGDPNFDLYRCLVGALDAIDAGGDLDAVSSAFDLAALGAVGLGPLIDDCTVCGGQASGTGRTAKGGLLYSPVDGGAVCGECAGRAGGATIRLSAAGVGALRQLARVGPGSAGRVRLRPSEMSSLRAALVGSVVAALERPIRTAIHAKALEIAQPRR